MLFESIARRQFGVAKDLLLGDRSLHMLKFGCYRTRGDARRNMLKLISALLDAACETQAAVPDELANIVCKLYEKSFEEAQGDTFGNASVSRLAALALRLADTGWVGFFGPNPNSEPEPEPEPEVDAASSNATVDINELRRQAVTNGMRAQPP